MVNNCSAQKQSSNQIQVTEKQEAIPNHLRTDCLNDEWQNWKISDTPCRQPPGNYRYALRVCKQAWVYICMWQLYITIPHTYFWRCEKADTTVAWSGFYNGVCLDGSMISVAVKRGEIHLNCIDSVLNLSKNKTITKTWQPVLFSLQND